MSDPDAPELCTAIDAPELPAGFPPVDVPDPAVEVQWFRAPSDWGDEVYACRIGNGGTPPYTVLVFVLAQQLEDPEPEVDELPDVRFPSPPELWTIAGDVCLEGAIFSFPSFIAGMSPPELGDGSVTTLTQIGAVRGSPAGDRYELSGAGVSLDSLPQGAGGGISA